MFFCFIQEKNQDLYFTLKKWIFLVKNNLNSPSNNKFICSSYFLLTVHEIAEAASLKRVLGFVVCKSLIAREFFKLENLNSFGFLKSILIPLPVEKTHSCVAKKFRQIVKLIPKCITERIRRNFVMSQQKSGLQSFYYYYCETCITYRFLTSTIFLCFSAFYSIVVSTFIMGIFCFFLVLDFFPVINFKIKKIGFWVCTSYKSAIKNDPGMQLCSNFHKT